MEIEFFCRAEEEEKWFADWQEKSWQWYLDVGLIEERMRWYEHPKETLAHYSKRTADIEYEFPFGWGELQGLANRGVYDLTAHSKHSGKDMSYFDPEKKERYIPSVIEPSGGVDRTLLAILCAAYTEDEVEGETRVLMKFAPRIAPIKAAVFPLVKKDGLADIAREFERKLRRRFNTFYDQSGAIGRRYRRMDEAGTPYCVTVDYETKENETVTVRERDSLEQVRMKMEDVGAWLAERVSLETM